MSYLNQRSKPTLDQERSEVLQQLEDWLETPMLVLHQSSFEDRKSVE